MPSVSMQSRPQRLYIDIVHEVRPLYRPCLPAGGMHTDGVLPLCAPAVQAALTAAKSTLLCLDEAGQVGGAGFWVQA
jgi:hypothetical protein